MKELLQKWEEYKKVYPFKPGFTITDPIGGAMTVGSRSPTFEDFMEWLKENV